jgi:hypothetical protein
MFSLNIQNINIGLSLPDLPDNDVWFANNAAWINYWKQISFVGDASIPSIDVPDFNYYVYDAGFVGTPVTISAVNYVFCGFAAAQELQAQLTALETSYREMRAAMKVAGLISENDN